jgi:hypothetical protein
VPTIGFKPRSPLFSIHGVTLSRDTACGAVAESASQLWMQAFSG